jgi:hypothetical protein
MDAGSGCVSTQANAGVVAMGVKLGDPMLFFRTADGIVVFVQQS